MFEVGSWEQRRQAILQAERDRAAEVARREQEGRASAWRRQREEMVQAALEARRLREERAALDARPFEMRLTVSAPSDAYPGVTIACAGGALATAHNAAVARWQAEDAAAGERAAAKEAESGEAAVLVASLRRLEEDTRRELAEARASADEHRRRAALLLGKGEGPGEAERAAGAAEGEAAGLEARLPQLAERLESARRAAAARESQVRVGTAWRLRQEREAAYRQRLAEAAPRLEALLRELLGLAPAGGNEEERGNGH